MTAETETLACPGQRAYEARFAEHKSWAYSPWNELPEHVKAIWHRVAAAVCESPAPPTGGATPDPLPAAPPSPSKDGGEA